MAVLWCPNCNLPYTEGEVTAERCPECDLPLVQRSLWRQNSASVTSVAEVEAPPDAMPVVRKLRDPLRLLRRYLLLVALLFNGLLACSFVLQEAVNAFPAKKLACWRCANAIASSTH